MPKNELHILTAEEVDEGAQRIRSRSHHPYEDLGLYYIILATGARPLEIARLEVRDYLEPDGCVRSASEFRPDVAINGRSRPLLFRSARLDQALDRYLSQRAAREVGVGADHTYRGLNPMSRLFLSSSGLGFEITAFESNDQKQYQCRGILEAYRKIFRYAGFKNMTALRLRQTVAARLYARGASDAQVGLLLGIAEPSAVRAQFPRDRRTLEELAVDLI